MFVKNVCKAKRMSELGLRLWALLERRCLHSRREAWDRSELHAHYLGCSSLDCAAQWFVISQIGRRAMETDERLILADGFRNCDP